MILQLVSGWHICSVCQKASHSMCYTCTYSLCKGCIANADYFSVRGNKGFCSTCMRTIMLIENKDEANKEMVCTLDIKIIPIFDCYANSYWSASFKRRIQTSLHSLLPYSFSCSSIFKYWCLKLCWQQGCTNVFSWILLASPALEENFKWEG